VIYIMLYVYIMDSSRSLYCCFVA